MSDSSNVRKRYDSADAGLRWERKPEVEVPRGWTDKTLEDPCVHGLKVSRAARNHCRKMRLQCRVTAVAPLQPRSLAFYSTKLIYK